jgi:hypothetical protein
MAHFAQINDNSIVTTVVVVADSDAPNEAAGILFCKDLLGADTNWVQTSYNNNIRCRYAGIGMKYDSTRDAFYPPKAYDNWVFDETRKSWGPPVARPSDYDTVPYRWNQSSGAWVGDS